MTGQVIDASPPASQVSSRLVLVAAIYLGVHASALMLTQSGDWGMGWARLPDVLGVVPYLLAIVTTAALVVLSSTAPGTLWAGLRRLAGWRGAVAFVCLVVVGTLIRPAAREYAAGVALTATFYGLELSLVCAAPASLSAGAADSLGRWATAYRPRLPWMLAGWTIMVCLAASWIVFERIPHVPDEVAYWFQAKYFAAGHLYLASPPDAAAFELPHTIVADGKWYSIFPPGWPMVLAAGMRIGAPWLINPLLGAASVLLLHALISDMYSRSTADLSALLLASSPMFLLMSSGLMSHPLSLVLALVALLGWRLGVRRGSVIRSLMGGLALGALVLTRPIEGAIFFAVMAAWGAVERRRRTSLAVFLLVAVAAGAVTLLYNRALTGSAAYDPITKYFDERYYPGSNRLGFGADIGNTGWQNDVRAGHSPAEAVINSHRNGYLLNLELFGWGFGSLAGVALFLLYGTWTRTDRFLASVAVAVVAALGLYWYAGADYGARYWYQLVVPLVVLTARGIESFAVRARESGAPMVVAGRATLAIGMASMSAVLVFLPWRAATKYHHYRGMGAAVANLAERERLEGALVFVRGAGRGTPFSRYSAAAVFNPPMLDGDAAIYVRETDAASRRRIECAFPGRPVRTIDTSGLPANPVVLTDEPPASACPAAVATQGAPR